MKFRKFLIIFLGILVAALPTACEKKTEKAQQLKTKIHVQAASPETLIHLEGKTIKGSGTFEVAGGRGYTIIAEEEGFVPAWSKVKIKNGEQKEVKFKLEPVKGSALLVSNEDGATITLKQGDKVVKSGASPLFATDLPIGDYMYRVEKVGFTSIEAKLKIEERGMVEKVEIKMNDTIGHLRLELDPEDAVVYINGKETHYNKKSLRLPAGNYEVRVTKTGYHEQNDKVEVRKGETSSLKFDLRQKPAKLSVLVKGHPDAKVYINNNLVISPEKVQEVPAGEYKIKVTKDFHDQVNLTVVLKPEQEEQVVIRELVRNTGSVRISMNHPGISIFMNGKKIGVTQPNPNGGAQDFLVEGLAVGGKYKFQFEHPYHFYSTTKTVTIKEEKKHAGMKVPFRVANATVKYKDGDNRRAGKAYVEEGTDKEWKITFPAGSGTGSYTEQVEKEKVEVTYLPEVKINPQYNKSSYDHLTEADK